MELVKKAKKVFDIIIGNTEESKKDILLNHLIDTIEVRGDTVHIKTKKNLLLENNGHIVTINSGMNVTMAKQIHLNPKIDFNDGKMKELKPRLDEARRLEQIEFEKQQEESQKQMGCNH